MDAEGPSPPDATYLLPRHPSEVDRLDLQALCPQSDDQCRSPLVHQRFMSTAVPVSSWADGLDEAVRVTRPGGWVELGEPAGRFEPAGPATVAVRDMFRALGASLGLDMDGVIFDSLDDGLRRAGLVKVGRRNIDLPIGEWGGRIGSLMASDLRAIAMRMAPVLQAQFDLPSEKWHEMLIAMQQEWVENHSAFPFAVAFGRKPR